MFQIFLPEKHEKLVSPVKTKNEGQCLKFLLGKNREFREAYSSLQIAFISSGRNNLVLYRIFFIILFFDASDLYKLVSDNVKCYFTAIKCI